MCAFFLTMASLHCPSCKHTSAITALQLFRIQVAPPCLMSRALCHVSHATCTQAAVRVLGLQVGLKDAKTQDGGPDATSGLSVSGWCWRRAAPCLGLGPNPWLALPQSYIRQCTVTTELSWTGGLCIKARVCVS